MSTMSLADEIATTGGVSLIELARQHRTAPSTVFRWVQRGLPIGNGTRAKLEAVRRGRRWLTSRAAVARFFACLPTNSTPTAMRPIRTPAKREAASKVATKLLHDKYGI
jgi:hypothetical protein